MTPSKLLLVNQIEESLEGETMSGLYISVRDALYLLYIEYLVWDMTP
jgi:hypothetical protein